MVFDPNSDNGLIMDGDSNNANAIWLLNWREIGLDMAKATGGWCIQILIQGGPSEMQKAEESMARDKGVPVIKLYLDNLLAGLDMYIYLKALVEALKTKPTSEERTVTYYPEAVVKGTVKEDEKGRCLCARGERRRYGDVRLDG